MAKPLSEAVDKAVTEMFVKMDTDGDGNIKLQEAQTFWGKNFSKINATALFNEVRAGGCCGGPAFHAS